MEKMKVRSVTLFSAAALLLCGGLALAQETPQAEGHEQHAQAQPTAVTRAIAVMHATEGNNVSGTVTFEQVEGGVRIQAELSGLSAGNHGFHVHDYGDCSAPDADSAGGHFNPEQVDHGGPDAERRHIGDFGNIEADDSGNARYDRVDAHVTFEGPHSVLGRGLIVHADPDDLTSQPTGAAGARLACGVIGVAAPPDGE
jgi:superoxide dismutase, Cu-Zn family